MAGGTINQKMVPKNPVEKSVTIIRPTVIFGERNRGNVYSLLKLISSESFNDWER